MGKKLNVGVVGVGRIGANHAEEIGSFPELFQWVACADHAPDRLRDVPENLKDAAKYTSLEEMLRHPGLDMVTIGTRHPDHVPMALQILEAGKIAVVEKPVATSVAEYDLLLEAAKKHPHKLFLRHNRRFEPEFVKAMELMNSGLIGDVQVVKLCRSCGFCRRNDWMTMTEFYGGLLTNWGPHLIDQALQFLASPVTDLWADVRRIVSIGDGDDYFKILLKGANGRLADVEVTGGNLLNPPREIEIIGNRGSIYAENGRIHAKYLDPCVELKDLKPHPENPPKKYGNFDEKLYVVHAEYQMHNRYGGPDYFEPRVLWEHLYREVTEGIPSPITLEQGREVVRITEEIFKKSGFEPIKKFKSKLLQKA